MSHVQVTPELVKHLAHLANLDLSADQLAKLEEKLPAIIGYMEEVTTLDLAKVPGTFRTIAEENVLREDEVKPSLSQSDALRGAKQSHDGYFVVEAIFEDKT